MKLILKSLSFLLVFSFFSCNAQPETETLLTVETTLVSFTVEEGTKTVSCSSDAAIEAVSSHPQWCTAKVIALANSSAIEITVSENTIAGNERTATITVTSGNAKAITVSVKQASIPLFPDGNEKFDKLGHRFFGKAEALNYLDRNGPFIRLDDGSIFAINGGTTYSLSNDEGRTWIHHTMLDPSRFTMASQLVCLTSKGTIIVSFSNYRELVPLNWNNSTHTYDPNAKLPNYVTYSRDNGTTWSEPLKLHDEWTGMVRDLKETEDGHIILSTQMNRNNPGRNVVFTYVSTDDGETWTRSNILDNTASSGDHSGLMEAAILPLNDSRIWMLIRTNWDYFYESYSSDHGLTWSAYQKTDIDASTSPGALRRLKSGRIVLVWNRLSAKGETTPERRGGDYNLTEVPTSWYRNQISMMYSDDDGKTWSTPFILATDGLYSGQGLSYPHVVELTKGVLWITTDYGNLRVAIKESDLPE